MEATQQNPSPKPTIEQFDQICEQTKWPQTYGRTRRENKKKHPLGSVCKNNVGLLHTNRKYHSKALPFQIKYSERW